MISKTLLKQTIKSNITLWAALTAVQVFALGSAVGGGSIPVAMTGLAFYGLFPGLITAIYLVVTSNKLIAAQVDRGTMAYILSTPIKRSKVAITQIAYLLGSLFIMFALTAIAHIIANYAGLGSITANDVEKILLLNLGLFVLNLALSGICFLASCIFNLSKYVIAVGGGLVGAFTLFSMMGMFGETFKWMKYLTLSTLYDINSVLRGSTDFIWKFIVLAVIGVTTYIIGSVAFTKRDLPL
jgi:ABC-2 type transport system permease protein